MARRVLCVAFDAADQGLLRQWAAEGHLPTIRALLDRSAWTLTRAPFGMHAASVWQTAFTATLPGKHGHHADRQIRTGTYEIVRARPCEVKRPPFWIALSDLGLHPIIIDVPYVTLSRGLNGLHVVDWTTHAADEGFRTWPPTLADEITTRFGRDHIGLCDDLHLRSAQVINRFRDALIARIDQKVALVTHLLARDPWDFFLVGFGESHCIGHQCWHLNDPQHPLYKRALADAVGNPMRDVYAALDAALGRIWQVVNDDTTVCFFATHGMGPYVNGAHLLGAMLQRLGHLPAVVEPSPVRRAVRWMWRQLPAQIRAPLIPWQKAFVDRTRPTLDPRATCFDVPNGEVFGAIRINLVGREPHGRIRPGDDFDAFCATLTADLCAVINAETGTPAVRRVLRTRDFHSGPCLDDLPDLLIEWSGEPVRVLQSAKIGTVRGEPISLRTGHHLPEGLFIVCDPRVPPGPWHEAVPIENVGPTLAQLLGASLPDVDGRPIPFPFVAA
jgi:predicted AlkP superfamily phosphohydrolase/phosphomutase